MSPSSNASSSTGRTLHVVLFGGGGLIGSRLAEWLLDQPNVEVVVTDIEHRRIRHLLRRASFTYYDSDLTRDRELTRSLIERADIAVSLVGGAHGLVDIDDVVSLTLEEPLRIARDCIRLGTRLLYYSSYLNGLPDATTASLLNLALEIDHELSAPQLARTGQPATEQPLEPSSVRGIDATCRHLVERVLSVYAAQQGLDHTIVRGFNVVGVDVAVDTLGDTEDSFLGRTVDAIVEGRPIDLGGRATARSSYLHVDDAVEFLGRLTVEANTSSGRTFDVANPDNEVSRSELAQVALNVYREHFWDGVSPLSTVTAPSASPLDSQTELHRHVPNITAARDVVGWVPTVSLEALVGERIASRLLGDRLPHAPDSEDAERSTIEPRGPGFPSLNPASTAPR